MHAIDTPTASAGLFIDGTPGVTPPTDLEAAWFNAVQQELLNLLSAASITPVKGTWTQVKAALDVLYDPNTIDVAVIPRGDYSANLPPMLMPQYPWSASAGAMASPSAQPAGSVLSVAWNLNGSFLAVGHNTTPFVTIYRRDGNTLTKLADPAALPANGAYSVAWSSDGQFLACAHATTPFVTIYQRSENTFTKLANPASLPNVGAGECRGVAWSPDGQYLALAQDSATAEFITIYRRTGTTFTKLSPATQPSHDTYSVAFSPCGRYLVAVGKGVSSSVGGMTVYRRDGDTFTSVSAPAQMPGDEARNVAFHPAGRTYVVTSSYPSTVNRYVHTYSINDSVVTSESSAGIYDATGSLGHISWSLDGRYLAIAGPTAGYKVYRYDGASYTDLSQVTGISNGTSVAAAVFSPDRQILIVAKPSATYLSGLVTPEDMPVAGRMRMSGWKRTQ